MRQVPMPSNRNDFEYAKLIPRSGHCEKTYNSFLRDKELRWFTLMETGDFLQRTTLLAHRFRTFDLGLRYKLVIITKLILTKPVILPF